MGKYHTRRSNLIGILRFHQPGCHSPITGILFQKRHISIGIVVGILIGFMMLGLQNRLETSKNRHSILKEWTRRYHLDDISLEKIEINLF